MLGLNRHRKGARPRVFVLGLDGVPCSTLRAEAAGGRLPNLAQLFREGSLVPMRSSLPSVSSTAWTTFFSGRDPGGHGVYGFMDCKPDSHEFYFPNYAHVSAPSVWDVLATGGKRSVVLNVPGTYPARPMNGSLVSGFVAPSIDRAVYPPELLPRLRDIGYRIDLDTWAARGNFEVLETELFATLDRRIAAIRMLLADDDWDLFVAVITETDRLYHFLWNAMAAGDERTLDLFYRFHARIDEFAGWLADALPKGTYLLTMSDHGFTTERVDVFTNAWLRERGYLSFDVPEPKDFTSISRTSTVYSLDPGRFYVNRAGRRPSGGVPADEADGVIERLVADLGDFRDCQTGELVYDGLRRRQEAYHGPYTGAGPDVVLVGKAGYELKGKAGASAVFGPPAEGLGGMHTYDDAHLYVRGQVLRGGPYELHDLAPTIVSLFEMEPSGFEGSSVLAQTPTAARR